MINTQAFPSRECFKHALVKNSQAFPTQECFKHTLVVNTGASPSRECINSALVANAQEGAMAQGRKPSESGRWQDAQVCCRLKSASADDKELSDSTWRKTSRSMFGRQLELDITCRRPAGVRSESGWCTKADDKELSDTKPSRHTREVLCKAQAWGVDPKTVHALSANAVSDFLEVHSRHRTRIILDRFQVGRL